MAKTKKMAHAWNIDKMLSRYKRVVPRAKEIAESQTVRAIHDILSSPAEISQISMISIKLEILGQWTATSGIVEVLNGNEKGWQAIRRAVDFRYWATRFLLVLTKRDGKPRVERRQIAGPLAFALAVNDCSLEERTTELLTRSVGEPQLLYQDWSPFNSFLVRLQVMRGRGCAELARVGLSEPFQQIIDDWNDPVSVGRSLLECCEYHCIESSYGRDLPDTDFTFSPYCEIPFEILAIIRLQEQEGRIIAVPDHPVIATKLCQLPEYLGRPVDDPLLEAVSAWAKREIQDL